MPCPKLANGPVKHDSTPYEIVLDDAPASVPTASAVLPHMVAIANVPAANRRFDITFLKVTCCPPLLIFLSYETSRALGHPSDVEVDDLIVVQQLLRRSIESVLAEHQHVAPMRVTQRPTGVLLDDADADPG